MKGLSIVLTAMLTLFVFSSQSMAQNVPAKVKQAFAKKFPTAKSVNWGKESDTEYEAEFTLNGKEASANFDTNGNWKETEMSIAEADLPYAVRQTLRRDYEEAEVMHAFEITSTGETMYEVEIKMNEEEENEEYEHHEKKEEEEEMENEKNVHELLFTKDGKVVNKQKMEEEEDDEDGK